METEETEENAETDGIPLQAAILIHFDRVKHSQSIVTHLPSIYTRLSILGPHVPSILDDGSCLLGNRRGFPKIPATA